MQIDSVAVNRVKSTSAAETLGIDLSRIAEARRRLDRQGISIRQWARSHQFPATAVYDVFNGRNRCLRGQAHQIAVALGLKDGDD